MAKFRKLTPSILRAIILEEKEKLMNESDPLVQGVEDRIMERGNLGTSGWCTPRTGGTSPKGAVPTQ